MTDEEKKRRKSEAAKAYNKANKDKITVRIKQYNQRPEVKERKKRMHDERKETDMVYLIKRRLRFRLRHAIKAIGNGKIKYKSAIDLLGCDINFFKVYIENKFTEGMSWDVIKLIDIDHIKPCAKFDLTLLEEQKKCFFYKNLQPMWKPDNLAKSDTYDGD